MGGVSGGAVRVDIDGALNDARYWGGAFSALVDVSWPIWADVGPGIRVASTLFVTSEADRLATSVWTPITFGLRYGP
jgi:hypothetical protein